MHERQRQRDERSPGMAEHEGTLDAQLCQGFPQQLGLRRRRPGSPTRPVAVAEARTVEHDDAVSLCQAVDNAADLELLDHRAVAMQQNQRRALAAVEVVEPDAVELDEAAMRRMLALGTAGTMADAKRLDAERGGRGEEQHAEARFALRLDRAQAGAACSAEGQTIVIREHIG